MRDDKLYKELGYQNFKDYCENEVGISDRMSRKYITIYEKWNPGSTFEKIGVAKLYLLSTLSEEERNEITEKNDIEEISKRELEDEIKKLREENKRMLEYKDSEIDSLQARLTDTGNAMRKTASEKEEIEAKLKEKEKDIISLEETIEELENTTEKALLLRDTFGFEVNESIRAANMLMTQFEMSADEAYTLIAQGAQNGLNKNDDLLDTINEYSVHYKQMGYTGEEFFNSLINGAEAGTFSVDKLGDAMKEFGIRTKDTADSTTEVFELIGLDADIMREKFIAGGETAREATEETITALFELDDKVKQNQAGVQLFGTMWEDLGADGVKALMDIKGEADKSANVLQDIADIRYDDLNSRFEGVKRQIGEEFLKPIAEDMMPKIEKGADYLVKNLPKMKETLEKAMPLVKGIGAGFVAWKAMNAVSTGISLVKNLSTALRTGDTAMRALNNTMLANPAIAVGTAIIGLTVAVSEYIKTCEPHKTELDKLLEKEQDYMQGIINTRDAINEKKEAGLKAAEADLIQLDNAQLLWKELETLADSTGKVKDKDKERAEYILNELNKALGTEYTLTDNQIQKYDELKNSIEKVIEMKKANILLEAGEGAYSDALVEKNRLEKEQVENAKKLAELEAQQAALRKQDGTALTRQDYKDYINGIGVMGINSDVYAKNAELYDQMDILKTRIRQTENVIADYYEDISDYEAAQAAILQENSEEAINILSGKSSAEKKYTNTLGDEVEKRRATLKKEYEDADTYYKQLLERYNAGVAGITKQTLDAAYDTRIKIQLELEEIEKSCKESAEAFAESVQKTLSVSVANDINSVWSLLGFKNQNTNIAAALLSETLNIPKHATGGYISGSSVGKGIVAEAGPELLEIVNGGVKITPLSDTARNTAVGGNSNDIKIYNTFHVQKMDKDTDIYSVSEKLARITSESLRGKGLI